jgi:hypothetical protein
LGVSLLLLGGELPAQATLSTLRGTATDRSGAIIPGVSITAANLDSQLGRTTYTNDNGDFEIPDLKRGTYRLTGTLAGFRTFVADNILLESNQTRRIDIVLDVGEIATRMTVRADAAVINTETGDISASVTSQQYYNVPLVAHRFDPSQTLTTMAGVVTPAGGTSNQSFNGQVSAQISEGMDGVWDDGTINQINNMDDVQEVRAVTSVPTAEYARAGHFNLVYKSGGNEFHGRLYGTSLNSALGARDFFEPRKSKIIISSFGVQLSGPIIKNRLFFYSSWNAERVPLRAFQNANVPTEKMRSGDFSQLLGRGIIVKDPLTGLPFPGNVIPLNRLNLVPLNVQKRYIPNPNQGDAAAFVNNFGWFHPRFIRNDYPTQTIDYKISDRSTVSGRFTNRFNATNPAGSLPDFAWTRRRHHSALAIALTHTFSPSLDNMLRFGWLKDFFEDGKPLRGFEPLKGGTVAADLGLQGVNPQGLDAQGFPVMRIVGFAPLRIQPGGVGQDDHNLSYADTSIWAISKHIAKFGGELRTFRNFNGGIPEGTFGDFTFDSSFSGFSYADFVLGLPRRSGRVNPVVNRTQTALELGLFAEDTFKATRRLNLYYGLRWDYFGSARFRDGKMYNWDPITGNVIVPSSRLNTVSPAYPKSIDLMTGRVVPHPARRNFRPRAGVAYRLTENIVFRGAYGQFSETFGRYTLNQGGGPFQVSEDFFNTIIGGTPLFVFPRAFPDAPGTVPSQSIAGYPLKLRHGVIHEFNVSIERQFHDVGVRISYIGARARGLNYFLNINKPRPSLASFTPSRRPFPQFVDTLEFRHTGETNYNALQIETQRKLGELVFDAHWTWARNLSNFLNRENPYSPNQWNPDSITPRHRIVINVIYNLPLGRGRRFLASAPGVVDEVLGGWSLYYLAYLQTGQFFSPSFSGSDPSNTSTFGGLPDRIRNGNLSPGQRTIGRWFDVDAFAPPPPGRFGNSGVNILEGPGYNAHHLAITKSFKLTERLKLEYQLSVSNLFNHPNFLAPNANISLPGQAGRIVRSVGRDDSQKGGPRQMEMKLRLEW